MLQVIQQVVHCSGVPRASRSDYSIPPAIRLGAVLLLDRRSVSDSRRLAFFVWFAFFCGGLTFHWPKNPVAIGTTLRPFDCHSAVRLTSETSLYTRAVAVERTLEVVIKLVIDRNEHAAVGYLLSGGG